MTESNDQNEMNDPNLPGDDADFADVPVDDDSMEVEAPRRAASAQFVVDSEIGSEAALREAMDPANQSLAEALRLSFRVLQLVIVVLVVLFFLSGFQTVAENQSGVLTRWGKIIPVDGQESLDPGLQFSWLPYPAGEFVIVNVDNRSVDLRYQQRNGQWRESFWPELGTRSIEDATELASVSEPIHPDRYGYVITRDGDLAHLQVTAQYEIHSPADYVRRVRDSDADRMVRLALRRATVHVAAEMSLQDIIDNAEELRFAIQQRSQEVLDATHSGVTLALVNVTRTTAPLAIRAAFGEVQSAQVQSEREIETARQRANQQLVNAAGEGYRDVIRLINRYEDASQLGETERASELLAEINALLDSDAVSGEVAFIIHESRAYRAVVEASLGNEARRFASLLPTFREHPELVIRQRWLQAYANVLSQEDSEVFFVPDSSGEVSLALAGLHDVKELRQKLELDRKEQESMRQSMQGTGYVIPWAQDMRLQGPGRQLEIQGDRVGPRRQPGS